MVFFFGINRQFIFGFLELLQQHLVFRIHCGKGILKAFDLFGGGGGLLRREARSLVSGQLTLSIIAFSARLIQIIGQLLSALGLGRGIGHRFVLFLLGGFERL